MDVNPSKKELESWLDTFQRELDQVVDFWLQNSCDDVNGGFFNCLDEEGKLYDSDKYGWLQGRQVWMFARLYNDVPRCKVPRLLEMALKGGDFLMTKIKANNSENRGGIPDDVMRCYFQVDGAGSPIKLQRTIFTEAFYVMGMSELYRSTQEEKYKTEAESMFQQIVAWVDDDSTLGRPHFTGNVPAKSLAVPMIVLGLIQQIESCGIQTGDESLLTASQRFKLELRCVDDILAHVQRGGAAILEHVAEDGTELPGSRGRLMNPGHAIEAGWFLLDVANKEVNKVKNTELTAALADATHPDLATVAIHDFISSSFRRGWDQDCGGLFSFLDADGPLVTPTQLEWRQKLWWPHCEAMVAFLKAFQHEKTRSHWDNFVKVAEYSFTHFSDGPKSKNAVGSGGGHGEWFGYLNQDGTKNLNIKGGPFKGCYHVPRALMMCEQILSQLLS